ncbi:DNA primase [Clostridium botulinum]|uniref:DNA primase n=1 Tax=Clostridium botulinum TaxID=1491 RepID=UPI00192A67A0|nr:DNA primase [Clostridium botulinum]
MIRINAYELKEYIIKENKTLEILEKIGCFNIKNYTKEYRCGSPKHTNATSISIKKDTLKIKIYTSENKIKGDLFTLIMDVKEISFFETIKYTHEMLGLKYIGIKYRNKKEKKIDILKIFKKALGTYSNNLEKLKIYEEDICSEFVKMPYIEWIREGILPSTQEEFGIGYSRNNNRIVIPHRYWCGNHEQYVGVIGRTLNKNYKLFDIPKYFPLYKFPKSMNIYGLQENYKGIQEKGYVNVFEAEKSTLKRHSKLDYTGVSLGGHEISPEQAKILIGLNVAIIIQMDSDIPLQHVRSLCEMFYGIRPVYYVYNILGLLKEKESPADKPNKVYNALWNRKVKYDKKEHQLYLEQNNLINREEN